MTIFSRILIGLGLLLVPGGGVVLALAFLARKMRLRRPRALPLRDVKGNEIYGRDDWHRDARRDYPIRYLLTETMPNRVSKIRWALHDRFQRFVSLHWRHDHLLDIRGPGYTWGKLEPGERLLYSTFRAFIEFMQGEGAYLLEITEPGAEVSPEDEHLLPAAENMRMLYHWWLETRPAFMASVAALPGGEDRYEHTQWAYKADRAMLRLLFDNRSVML
jgi:hypothetical protein